MGSGKYPKPKVNLMTQMYLAWFILNEFTYKVAYSWASRKPILKKCWGYYAESSTLMGLLTFIIMRLENSNVSQDWKKQKLKFQSMVWNLAIC